MKIYELFTQEELQDALDNKLVKKEKHPYLDLWIYNYTANCQFKYVWNDVTLNCRGLIVDNEDNVVARPFKKFFSYEQLCSLEQFKDVANKVKKKKFEVFEKLDGSLIIVTSYKGNKIVATRGSFVSEQAKLATQILDSKYSYFPFYEGRTYLFELISPKNRIVVDYGKMEDLVFLELIENDTGNELGNHLLHKFPVPKKYYFESFEQIAQVNDENIEGFVLKFDDNFRLKAKTEEYKRLHRLITGVSEKTIWEALKNREIDQLLEDVPDEFYVFVEEVKETLETQYVEIERAAKDYFVDLGDRKQNALHYQHFCYPSILFKMLDGSDYSDIIWKVVKPKAQSVFRSISEDAN